MRSQLTGWAANFGKSPAVRIAAATAGALVILTATAGPASAHTSLKAASPSIGSTVSPPTRILLTFVDPVRFPQVVLSDAAGRRHESGPAQAVDNTVTEQIAGPLASGVYTVGWRVVATDGHPVSGEYRFIVKGGSAATAADPAGGVAARTTAPAAASSGAAWWWIGFAALLVAGIVAGVVFVRRTLRRDDA
jgi:methionine-rich copper-binding protein CopC